MLRCLGGRAVWFVGLAVSLSALPSHAQSVAQTAQSVPSANASAPEDDALDRALGLVLRSACQRGLKELKLSVQPGGGEASAVAGRVERACDKVLRVSGSEVRSLPSEAVATQPPRPARVTADSPVPSEFDRSGRAVLVSGTTLYGLWAGAAADVLLEVNSARAAVVPPLVGLGAGLGGSLAVTATGGVTKGQAWGVITGLDYGTYVGLLLGLAVDVTDAQPLFGTMLATGLAGGLFGATVAWQGRPSHGSVEMTRSGGLWGSASAVLLAAIVQPSWDAAVSQMVLVGMLGGLATGAALSTEYEISRDRMLLGDAGALAGVVATTGLFFLFAGDNVGRYGLRLYGGLSLLGLHGGLATSLWLSRDWDSAPQADAAAATVPALVERNDAGHWRAGRVSLQPTFEQWGAQSSLVGAWVPVVGGNW